MPYPFNNTGKACLISEHFYLLPENLIGRDFTCSASSLLMASANWSCKSSSPELWGHACSESAPECSPPPKAGAEGAEEAKGGVK